MRSTRLFTVLQDVRACRLCADHLPLEPRPLLAAHPASRIVLIGQAPGRAAHESGVPWDDRSGDRLRAWLGISRERFYDCTTVAIIPMGFCFPGTGRQGDLAPRVECAPLWHGTLFPLLRSLKLTIYLGRYAFEKHVGFQYKNLTEAVHAYEDLLPDRIVLPHPSPRNAIWLKKHPWFESRVLPALKARISAMLG
jgi:uracil-DNA glycosylase